MTLQFLESFKDLGPNAQFMEGVKAFLAGKKETDNEYKSGTPCAWDWEDGFDAASERYKSWQHRGAH